MGSGSDEAVKDMRYTAKLADQVNHPKHYGGEDNPYEAIKVIEAWKLGFNVGNTVKYLARHGMKPGADPIEDLKKAKWYLEREIKKLEKEYASER